MKKIWLLAACAMLCSVTEAQVPVTSIVQPRVTFVNATGGPCVGCKLYSYVAGTTTPFPTYTDSTGSSQNTNPIVLDASGGAFIWVGRSSYKFILKDPLGSTLWTVDNVNEGNLFPCGPAGSVQIANIAVTGMDCDAAIFINKTNHTLNVGILPANHVVIGALSTPTLWTLDTTTPATALASMNGVNDGAGTTTPSLLAISTSTAHALAYTNTIPNGTMAVTQASSDNSTKVATTAYVASPGAIDPTSLQIAAGIAMTANQGTGTSLQHSTGATVTDNCVKFDAAGNTVDAGISCGGSAVPRTCNSNGCYRVEADGTISQWGISSVVPGGADTASVTVTFPTTFTTTTNLSFVAWADNCGDSACTTKTPVAISGNGGPSTSLAVVFVSGVVPTGGGGSVINNTIHVHWQAVGN